ncbi:KIR protein [Plasmodium knowlesi strain H]|uniref:KIR protein n=3 Tax=Plasmodium knowlesi TaxID=5850 RepID=A0A5K1UAR9_PLAKH|nr:KIR protein [Plasmodium knowlesi strain H]OTN66591.1 KIR protein [Plasmodium knowlesi]CAA9990138.1 KIR protein [Plasmodium knowlesi strain H]SBO25824.1 KIR protein [Plasmodium knowlesi strain H]SBO28611.1 KIR protein [Plasmodium knowlesi strain H]VVS79612.1 KIR protein [Plasmodium knowlesi strain H]|eukprot:XP_002260605.1 KIR protein [Plasmodium knowlesi strain H]
MSEEKGNCEKELPSKLKYDTFKNGTATCNSVGGSGNPGCSTQLINKVLRALQGKGIGSDLDNLAKEIVSSHYYACSSGIGMSSREDEWCYWFYYWLGDQIKDKLKNGHTFEQVMQTIYGSLIITGFSCKCSNLYRDMNETIFENIKKLFDYTHDCNHIKGKISSASTSTGLEAEIKCFPKYKVYLTAAVTACNELKSECQRYNGGSGFPQNNYCSLYQQVCQSNGSVSGGTETGGNNIPKPSELLTQLTDAENKLQHSQVEAQVEEQDEEMITVTSTKELTEEHLNTVKAESKYYEELSENSEECAGDSTTVEYIKNLLLSHTTVDINTDRIMQAWCHAHREWGGTLPPHGERCHSLYYWVGSQIFKGTWYVSKFEELMNNLFSKLQSWKPITGCSNLYPNIGKDEFNRKKEIFEHLQQYHTMKRQLEQSIGGGKGTKAPSPSPSQRAKCDQIYSNHLKDVIKSLTDEYTKCTTGNKNTEPYCSNFLQMCSQCKPDELTKLECEVTTTTEGQTSESAASSSSSDSTSGGVGGAVGGGLASVALPAIGFYLYKYTDLFDGIKKSLFGGSNNTRGRNRSRGRRFTIRRQHFDDTFTGNDFSTLGGDGSTTLGAGGGGESSTLDGSSTDVSTIYNEPLRPPTGREGRAGTRTGTNNRRPGNIRYYAT